MNNTKEPSPCFIIRDATQYYGETEEDHYAIKRGIDLYYEDYPNASPGINRTFP